MRASMTSDKTLAMVPEVIVRDIVTRALAEDLGRGDVTSDACVPPHIVGEASLNAREPLVLSGIDVFATVFAHVDAGIMVDKRANDGAQLRAGDAAAIVRGRANSILKAERVALNLTQRMSAVATRAAHFVAALPAGSKTRITDTRKTTPGLRALERYAVRCGGAHNHRDDLSSAVLIKDNHIAACGSVRAAIVAARAHAPHTSRIECEVGNFDELREALEARADIVMLDNFDDRDLEKAVALVDGRALIEVSGRVTKERIAVIASAGIDVISIGAITHSAPAVDLALDWT